MERRGFLGAIAALVSAPLLANIEFVRERPLGEIPPSAPVFAGPNGVYQYVRALTPLKTGDPVFWKDGSMIGYAAGEIDRGNYGFACITAKALDEDYSCRGGST